MTVSILGMPIRNVTMAEAVRDVSAFFEKRESKIVVTPNAEILKVYIEDPEAKKSLDRADYIVPDGVGVILAAKMLKTPLKEKVAGVELGTNLLIRCAETGKRVYFLGGKPGVAAAAREELLKDYPALQIVGLHDGYFKPDEEGAIIEEINRLNVDMLFVCMGAPRQEHWMADHKDRLKVGVMLGLGGTLDILAKTLKRAPDWMIKLGIEWLYRVVKEPRRIKRIIQLPFFLLSVKRRTKKRG